MVQEFHVLRCCSCQTYQVQQVKKCKKWNCKLCGEKQSVIKEFGRGSGVDCRRHVQKLNARRGEILEEQDQEAWSRWEEVDDVAEEVVEKTQECFDQNAEEANGSRWSKYLQTSDEGAGQEEAEEEENVYMDRKHLRGNINVRKRGRENEGSGYHSEEEDSMPPTQGWRTEGKSANHNIQPSSLAPVQWSPKPSAPCRPPVPAYSKPPTGTEPPSTTSSKPSLTSAPYRANTARTSQPSGSSGTAASQTSKWAQFLTSAPPEEDVETNCSGSTMHMDEFQITGSMFSNLSVVRKHQNYKKASIGQLGCSGISILGGLGGDSGFLGKSTGKTVDRFKSTITHCGLGEAANSERGPAHMALPEENEVPVCHQPLPTKCPCPALSLGILFYTDDDFDDTF